MGAEIHLKLLRHRSKLQAVLANSVARSLFSRYMHFKQHADCLLWFCDAVDRHRKVEESGLRHAGITIAQDMFSKYIMYGSPRDLQLPEDTQQQIIDAQERGGLTSATFVDAKHKVFTQISEDYLPEFLASKAFDQLIESLGSDRTLP